MCSVCAKYRVQEVQETGGEEALRGWESGEARPAVCSFKCAVCSVQCAVCSVQCVVCCLECKVQETVLCKVQGYFARIAQCT